MTARGARPDTTKMISRNLARRLENLESGFVPAGEAQVFTIDFVDSDGKVVDRKEITWGARSRTPPASGRDHGHRNEPAIASDNAPSWAPGVARDGRK